MSLWHKPMDAITFADVDAFCQTMQTEGMRLDYKLDRPKDLAKLVAAFANTNGGLILLGVEADPTTNKPIWPPLKGMLSQKGVEEAVISIARDAIYPPATVQVSPVLENSHLPGHVVVVVRVDESREAPHAVDDGRKVYERTGSTTKPYDFACIDRIRHLLERREKIEEHREAIRREAIARAERIMEEALRPLAWVSVIPVYPWRDLCSLNACFESQVRRCRAVRTPAMYREPQRIPGGAVSRTIGRFRNFQKTI
jgi:hypothetical protein